MPGRPRDRAQSSGMTVPSPTATERLALDALLADLIAERGRAAWREIDPAYLVQLTRSEALIVESAVAKRRAEFATGRSLLRTLLDDDVEILRSPSGTPMLPSGYVGSLTHDAGIALGVVAPSGSFEAVGIDVEPLTDLDEGVAEIVVRGDDVTPDPMSAFVAKEAAYKVWSVLGGAMLEHHDVQVIIDGLHYRAIMADELVLHGKIGRAAGRVVACVFSPANRSISASRSSLGDH